MLDPHGLAGYLYDDEQPDHSNDCTICDGPCHCDTDHDHWKDTQ